MAYYVDTCAHHSSNSKIFHLQINLNDVLCFKYVLCSGQIFTCFWCWVNVHFGPCYHKYITVCVLALKCAVYSALTVRIRLRCLYVWASQWNPVVLANRAPDRQTFLLGYSSACLKKQQGGLEPLVTPGPHLNQLIPPFPPLFSALYLQKYRV